MAKKLFFIILVFITARSICFSQSKLTLIAPDSAALNELFQIRVELNTNPESDSGFIPPDMHNFHVYEGPSKEMIRTFTQNDITASVIYSYVVKGKLPGSYSIGRARMNESGEHLESNDLRILITDSVPDSLADVLKRKIDRNVFFTMSGISKKQYYTGEVITADFNLYYDTSFVVSSIAFKKVPEFNGFKVKNVTRDSTELYSNTIVDGKVFKRISIGKFFISANKSGVYSIKKSIIDVMIEASSSTVVNALRYKSRICFFPITLQTKQVTVEIRDIKQNQK